MRRVLLLLQARVLEAVRIKDGRIAIFVLSIAIENHANFQRTYRIIRISWHTGHVDLSRIHQNKVIETSKMK